MARSFRGGAAVTTAAASRESESVYYLDDMRQGVTFDRRNLTFTETDSGTAIAYPNGTRVNCTIKSLNTGAEIYRWSSDDGSASIAGDAICLHTISPTITAKLKPGLHRVSLTIRLPGGAVRELIGDGRIKIERA